MTRSDVRQTPTYYGGTGQAAEALRVLYAPRPARPAALRRSPLRASAPARQVREGAASMSALMRAERCAERDA